MSRTARRVISLLAAAILSLSIAPVAVANHLPAAGRSHCASLVGRPSAPTGISKVVRSRCFTSFASAVRYASRGAVVPDDVTPETMDEIVVPPAGRQGLADVTTIIGIHWEHVDRGGRDRLYFVKGSAPCDAGHAWQISQLDAGWDTLVSSAEGFGGCDTFEQFRDPKLKGASRACTPYCATLGALNDQVSSVRWRS